MTGEWDGHYAQLTEPFQYGDDASYEKIAEFVTGPGVVADWGCGGGGLRRFLDEGQPYLGIDGSCSPFADVVADLESYAAEADYIVLRHVLEHSFRWVRILDNAVRAFREKLCIVLFTPCAPYTHVLQVEPDFGDVPVIAFCLDDIRAHLPLAATVTVEEIEGSVYGIETIIRVVR